jgi:hypothetical protein
VEEVKCVTIHAKSISRFGLNTLAGRLNALDGQLEYFLHDRRLSMRRLRDRICNSFAANQSATSSTTNSYPNLIIGYAELIQQRIREGWQPYLITFMFNRLPGNQAAVIKQMQDEVERVYATLVTRVVRKPRSPKSADRLPVFIGFADRPVPKRERKQLREIALNGGLHYHGILLMPARSRLRTGLAFHFMKYQRLYLRDRSRLDRIHVLAIESDPCYVVRYALKALENGRLPYDDCVLVLPKSVNELGRAGASREVMSMASESSLISGQPCGRALAGAA